MYRISSSTLLISRVSTGTSGPSESETTEGLGMYRECILQEVLKPRSEGSKRICHDGFIGKFWSSNRISSD